MILLRTGNASGAEQIFEHGVLRCPFAAQRDYFRNALAVVRLRRRQYRSALDLLTQVTLPALRAPANVVLTHALGLGGDAAHAAEAFARIPTQGGAILLETREELRRRFIAHEPGQHDDDWLFEREIELLAAA